MVGLSIGQFWDIGKVILTHGLKFITICIFSLILVCKDTKSRAIAIAKDEKKLGSPKVV